jgi:two-component system sensor histidine kinase AlgZ
MPSIKQNPAASPLPDFRNFGVMLRVLLGVNLLVLAAALVQSAGLGDWLPRFVDMAAWVQPLLIGNLALLALFAELLRRLPANLAQFLVVLVAAGSAIVLIDFYRFMEIDGGGWSRMLRAGLLAGTVAIAMLFYFALRASAFSPAVAEARLHALTARIRPHFLFNSLNAVLSLIRSEPRRAETALEDLADLFRVLMRDHRELLPLADEIALSRQYLDLEKLRLGERLRVEWKIADVPDDLKVPPLMLQPLLENAVYHGIEPSSEPGTIRIGFWRSGEHVHIDLTNPCGAAPERSRGQHMALANIRERLMLHYDLEASLEAGEVAGADGSREYRVHIVLPCRNRSL